MNPALLDVRSLHKSFDGTPVLRGLDLQLEAGARLSIQGSSGCGKSTLLRLIAGLETPDQGSIHLKGQVASEAGKVLLPPWQRGVQMVFQDLGLWPTRRVLQHVVDVRKAAGLTDPVGVGTRILEQLGLGKHLKRRPGHLSGGEARRLAFARVMALEPQLLLLDEAFSSLDASNRVQGFEMLEQVLAETGAAVILVTHDPTEAERLGGLSCRLEEGVSACA